MACFQDAVARKSVSHYPAAYESKRVMGERETSAAFFVEHAYDAWLEDILCKAAVLRARIPPFSSAEHA